MAGQHPVTRTLGDKFDVTRLRHTHEHRVSRAPGRLRLSPSFCSRDYKLMTVEVDWVVIHPEVDQANAHPFPMPYEQRSSGRPGFPVEGEPVELHVHGVGDSDIR